MQGKVGVMTCPWSTPVQVIVSFGLDDGDPKRPKKGHVALFSRFRVPMFMPKRQCTGPGVSLKTDEIPE